MQAVVQKSYDDPKNKVVNYCLDHSDKLTVTQQKLFEVTRNEIPMAKMLGAPEVVCLGQNLIRSIGGKRVLDIGCYTGFSALGWALALPDDGLVISMDVNEETTKVAQKFWKEAGVDGQIQLKLQPASKTLDELLAANEAGKFDFAFLDADKESYDYYYECCLKLLKPGGIICIDNTLWSCKVVDAAHPSDASTIALQKLNDKIASDARVSRIMLPVADGITLVFLPRS